MKKPRVLVADPPWFYKDKLPGKGRGAAKKYKCMKLVEICNYPIPAMADESWLWLWRTHNHAEEARAVMRAWGYGFAGELVWEKLTKHGKRHFGMGRSGLRYSHEVCLLGKRGKPQPLVKNIHSIITARAPSDEKGKVIHSAKPDEFYDLVERHSDGPYVELFARKPRVDWIQMGDQLGART